jgi:predicted unusual protein kinase regulating ubiquinone biosynthesis (AarF/ABC1/UbiB family)
MAKDKKSKFNTNRSSRFLKLSALSGKVGSSYLGQAVKSAFLNDEQKSESLIKKNLQNARRIANTFGELKGAVMKVGQMLSLQEDLLPEEMRDILRGLQNQAPPVPFELMRPVLEEELGKDADKYIKTIEEEALASASIGQVHRAILKDGREVVLKIQYPDVYEMVDSDLKNLRVMIKSFFKFTPMKADFDKFFNEVRSVLLEELDYRQELHNILEFGELFKNDDRFVVPKPVKKLSSHRVLTMEYVPGITGEQLCSDDVDQSRRDKIASDLCELMMIQFFDFRTLQADPNLANFAFSEDDKIILYDFGCVKRFPSSFTEGIRKLMRNAMLKRYHRIVEDLDELGYRDLGRSSLPNRVYREYIDVFFGEWREPGKTFSFGQTTMHEDVIRLNRQYWQKSFDFDAPADMVFMNRSVGGMYGNLRKLNANVPLHDLMKKYLII